MDNGSQTGLTLLRMPQGGFLVVEAHRPFRNDPFNEGSICQFHFASTTIAEALDFMRDKIAPIPPQQQEVKS